MCAVWSSTLSCWERPLPWQPRCRAGGPLGLQPRLGRWNVSQSSVHMTRMPGPEVSQQNTEHQTASPGSPPSHGASCCHLFLGLTMYTHPAVVQVMWKKKRDSSDQVTFFHGPFFFAADILTRHGAKSTGVLTMALFGSSVPGRHEGDSGPACTPPGPCNWGSVMEFSRLFFPLCVKTSAVKKAQCSVV